MSSGRHHDVVVFLGPSLPLSDARAILRATYVGPVRCGDLLRVRRLRPRTIAIVDGIFEGTPPVWHKEILLALEDGIEVFGAASMGALRAAELSAFGMIGLGRIFEAYRDGMYTDDDEVALLHGPASAGHRGLTEPMVNVRATVERAVNAGILNVKTGKRVVSSAKAIFYQDRTMERVIAQAWRRPGTQAAAVRFRQFIDRGGYVDQKRLDTVRLLKHLADRHALPRVPAPVGEPVARTRVLLQLHYHVMCRPFAFPDLDLPVAERVALEARLLGVRYRLLRRLAQLMSVALSFARADGGGALQQHTRDVYRRDPFGLGPAATTRRWAATHDLDDEGARLFVRRLAEIGGLLEASSHTTTAVEIERRVLVMMRIEGRFLRWRPATGGFGERLDRRTYQRLARNGGIEFELFRRVAQLWAVVDDAATRLGFGLAQDAQTILDEFRLARGLSRTNATLHWMRDHSLSRSALDDLAIADARLSLLTTDSRAHTLGLGEEPEPICLLHDAIRLAGLYPGLRRQVRGAPPRGSRLRRRTVSAAELYRQYFLSIDEPLPDDIERYAFAQDFPGGEAEFLRTLQRSRNTS